MAGHSGRFASASVAERLKVMHVIENAPAYLARARPQAKTGPVGKGFRAAAKKRCRMGSRYPAIGQEADFYILNHVQLPIMTDKFPLIRVDNRQGLSPQDKTDIFP
jgi:hypothetical protein